VCALLLLCAGYEGKKKPWETTLVPEGRTQALNKSQTTGKPIKIKDLCNDDRTTNRSNRQSGQDYASQEFHISCSNLAPKTKRYETKQNPMNQNQSQTETQTQTQTRPDRVHLGVEK